MQEIINSKETRQALMERIEVLDKVKSLFLIPGHEVMTTKQVADYFEVDETVIRQLYLRNHEEIDTDGTELKHTTDFVSDNLSLTKKGVENLQI